MIPEWIELILQLGFPTATVIFLAWKGIPWLQDLNKTYQDEQREQNEKHNIEMRTLMTTHLSKMEEKDSNLKEIHDNAMKIIEANTRAINSLAIDVGSLKETNVTIKSQIEKTNELINWLKADLTKNAG